MLIWQCSAELLLFTRYSRNCYSAS